MVPREVWGDPRYDIHIAVDSFIYLEIQRGMYGLKEAGVIAFDQLVATSTHTDTNRLHILQDSGATLQDPPRSPCALAI